MTDSIEKRGKNSYRLVVFKVYDLDGKPMRHQKTIHCKKKSEAQIELAKFLTEVESGLIVAGNIPTFAQYVEIWTKDYALKELAPSTYYRYKRMLATRTTLYFGHYKLNKIKPTDIMRFYDLLEEDTQIVRRKNNNGKKTRKPLSQKTILEHHPLLSALLHKAVYWQLIVSNPAERVQPPKTSNPLRRHYDEKQTKILVDNLQKLKGNQIKYHTAILLDIFTEARLGKLVGLEWSDIDFKNGIININKSGQYLSEKGIFTKAPKIESSIRDVTIPDFIVSLLEEYKLWYDEQKSIVGDFWHESNRLFVQDDVKPIYPSTISKWFEKLVKQIGLSVFNFPVLGYTNVSLMIANSIQYQIISRKVGYSSIQVTDKFYSHFFDEDLKNVSNIMNNVFSHVQ